MRAPQLARDLFGDTPQPKVGIGYAGTPGLGPKNETCGSCAYSCRHGHSTRRYYKCTHEQGYTSLSRASDIKVKMPACEHWSDGK